MQADEYLEEARDARVEIFPDPKRIFRKRREVSRGVALEGWSRWWPKVSEFVVAHIVCFM